ncbi:MAG: DNRLRE domain-containing protein, partial [Deltaproteobacteria bacterium]|nr:DNRLRE domain-containing protein [Deltaproteobacteria bacterium]
GGDGNVYSYFVSDDSWTETGVTWNNQPTATTTAALGSWWIWDDGTVHDMVGTTTTAALTSQVQTELDGDKTLSLMLSSPGYTTTYYTREGDPAKAASLTVTYEVPQTATLNVVADTWVSQASPSANYGTDGSMQVVPPWSGAPAGNVLVKFDLSSLPAGAVISSATLTATASTGFAYGGDGNVYGSFVADDSWTETGVTWSNQPTANTASPLGSWWLWDDGTVHDMVGTFTTPQLAAQVQTELGGDKTLSLMLASPGYTTTYYTREGNPAKAATLTVAYLMPETKAIIVSADTWVSQASPDTNYGTDSSMQVVPPWSGAPAGNVLVKFDLSSLPATAVISSATLTATASTGFAYGGDGNV